MLKDEMKGRWDTWLTDPVIECVTDRLADRLTDRQTDRLTDWRMDWLTDHWLKEWLIDVKYIWNNSYIRISLRMTDCLIDWLIYCLTAWLIDCLTGWLTYGWIDRRTNWLTNDGSTDHWLDDWLTDWMTDWLTDWMNECHPFYLRFWTSSHKTSPYQSWRNYTRL